SLKQELDHKSKESADYLNHLKRLQADFENYIKRSDKERKEFSAYASEKLIVKLLTVLDEFEQALDAMKKGGTKDDLVKGVELLYKNFHKILADEGVQPIQSVGVPADPYLHEVILKEKKDGTQDGIIIQELQKGYKMKDKVVRYAKVKVATTGEN
ncbi:MAG TPA: nucleotide exchange factor GrpE, partial [Candidatus Binatia bacterium]|nr:nucleotide exchange factor GrpE [Candidatus Binatia bacterium]